MMQKRAGLRLFLPMLFLGFFLIFGALHSADYLFIILRPCVNKRKDDIRNEKIEELLLRQIFKFKISEFLSIFESNN